MRKRDELLLIFQKVYLRWMDFPNIVSVYFVIDINHQYEFICGVCAFNSIVKLHNFVLVKAKYLQLES